MSTKSPAGTDRVLYDGWALAYQPSDPAALHLLTILELHPEEFEPVVALPAQSFHPLPEGTIVLNQPTVDSPASRLKWEQRVLPGLAASSSYRLVHLLASGPSLLGGVPQALSPTAFSEDGLIGGQERLRIGWAARLRQSAGWGGLTRLAGLIWPAELPLPDFKANILRLPGVVHPVFQGAEPEARELTSEIERLSGADLPETYVLYHGPTAEPDLRRLLNAWNWAAGPIGDFYPLLCVGRSSRRLENLLAEFDLGGSVHFISDLPLHLLVALYQGCSVFFHPAPVPAWGDPLRMALACGKPVVALDSPRSSALVGPAAYLAPSDPGGRKLGAALLSVIVEESLASRLAEAARQRHNTLDSQTFTHGLEDIYRTLLRLNRRG